MRRGTFAHAERPGGAPPPQHNPQALNALSALAKRGGHNVHTENLQRPMPQRQPLPQGSLPVQALGAAQAPQQPAFGQAQGMPQVAPQQPAFTQELPPVAQEQPPEVMSDQEQQPDFWAKRLEEIVQNDPNVKPGHWLHDFSDKSKKIRTTINRIRELADKL